MARPSTAVRPTSLLTVPGSLAVQATPIIPSPRLLTSADEQYAEQNSEESCCVNHHPV